MKRHSLVALIACLPFAAAIVTAQTPAGGWLPAGTGAIAGLLTADNGDAIPRAVVTIGGGTFAGFTTMTDANGRFTFDRLPAGQFVLRATKPGFLPMAYGQAEPGRGSGLPIELKTGERLSDIRWTLPRAAAIVGRLLDQRGQPMRAATINVQVRREVNGNVQFDSRAETKTDGNGLYRVSGLLPGTYVVAAFPPGDYMMTPEVMSSYGPETRQVTDQEVQWALREIEAAGARGAGAPRLPEPPRGRTVSYGRIFFPGTPNPARADTIALKAGEERGGVDFAMPLQPTALIRGRAIGPDGQPAVNATLSFSEGWSTATTALAADGVFERRHLLAGRYTLTVRGRGSALWGSRTIDLAGVDQPDVVITLGPAASLGGRVVFEPGEPPPDLAAVRVSVSLVPTMGVVPVRVAPDGTFTFPVVDAGQYRLTTSIPAANRGTWALKSVMVGGVDALDVPIVIEPGQAVSGAVVTFTTKTTSVSGTLFTAAGAPAGGYYVVMFGDDPAAWSPRSRRVPPAVRASTDGRFVFRGLPPGTYRLAALTSVDETDLGDPAFLEALKRGAVAVTLAEGEAKTQDIRFAHR